MLPPLLPADSLGAIDGSTLAGQYANIHDSLSSRDGDAAGGCCELQLTNSEWWWRRGSTRITEHRAILY